MKEYGIPTVSFEACSDGVGLANGQMKSVLSLFISSRILKDAGYEKRAEHLLDELCENLSLTLPLGLADGLCGIGWGISYLLLNGFVSGDPDEILKEIDNKVVREMYYETITDLGLDCGLLGVGEYLLMRIVLGESKRETVSGVVLKENLIYLVDRFERSLSVKADFSVERWLKWFSEARKTGIYKTKMDKMICLLQRMNIQ